MESKKIIKDTKLDDLFQLENLDELIMVFENNVNEAIDQHAPEKMKIITVQHSNPWFTKEVKDQKRVVCNREKIWQKYRDMLRRIRTDKITEKVTECAGNTKKLYSLVSYLTGSEIENPMPPGKMDGELAEEFAEYFMQKIKTIQESLEYHSLYTPRDTGIPELETFKQVSESDVKWVISKMKTKSCELDVLPTFKLKELIENFQPIITKIVNLSLAEGKFLSDWKNA